MDINQFPEALKNTKELKCKAFKSPLFALVGNLHPNSNDQVLKAFCDRALVVKRMYLDAMIH